MKFLVLFCCTCFTAFSAGAQHIAPADLAQLHKNEDSLKRFAENIQMGVNPADRLLADSNFTRLFVRSLRMRNSIYYPFDSLYSVSKLYAPDSSFRIYTWQMVINENVVRQHGAIQMKTADGSLKLFPLIDKSDVVAAPQDTIADNFGWIGAVYYKIIKKETAGKAIYTLLGYDEGNIRSTRKIIEFLQFKDGKPLFGSRQFSVPAGIGFNNKMARLIMEFKKDASPRLVFDADLDLIVMEHLISESNQPDKKWTLVGDGDYQGFKWTDNRWVYIDKLFNQVTPLGQQPMPAPILDDAGNVDESKLKENRPGFTPSAPKSPVKRKDQ